MNSEEKNASYEKLTPQRKQLWDNDTEAVLKSVIETVVASEMLKNLFDGQNGKDKDEESLEN